MLQTKDRSARHQKLYDAYERASSYFPAAGLMIMGTAIAQGYAATGRADLLAGGSLLALLGVGIADIAAGKNYMARLFNKVAAPFKKNDCVSQGHLLTAFGVASCATLAGGEAVNYVLNHGHEPLSAFLRSASFPKIAANLAPFMITSVIDTPAIQQRLNRLISSDKISTLKTGLNALGAYLIIDFAQKANLPTFEVLGQVQLSTTLAGSAFWLLRQDPKFFQPFTDAEELAARHSSDPGAWQAHLAQRREILLRRGFSETDLQHIDAKAKRMAADDVAPSAK